MSNEPAQKHVPHLRLPAGRHPQGLLRRDQRGRAGHVGRRHRRAAPTSSASSRIEAGIEGTTTDRSRAASVTRPRARHRDELRRNRGGRRRRRHDGVVVGRVEPDRSARALRRRRARTGWSGPSRDARSGHRRRARPSRRRPGATARRSPSPKGPGLIGALLVGLSHAKALSLGVGRAVRRRQPPRGSPLRLPARTARSAAARDRAAGQRRPHHARARQGPRRLRDPRRHDRRRRGRGLRQGRRVCSASATRAGRSSTSSPRTATPRTPPFPKGMRDESYDFSFSGVKTSVARRVAGRPVRSTRPTWPPGSRRPSSTSSWRRPSGP